MPSTRNSQDRIPLHHADLSGYGLSAFSEWRLDAEAGVTKAHFQVLNGRTAYEVIQFRSALYECGARVVRTITLERRNSAAVILTDSGWVPIEDGLFQRPHAVRKGRGQGVPQHPPDPDHRTTRSRSPPDAAVQPVIFDADAEIEGLEGGGAGGDGADPRPARIRAGQATATVTTVAATTRAIPAPRS